MIRTRPIALSFLTTSTNLIGPRVQRLLEEPFEVGALKRRVLQTTKDNTKAKPAWYIDTRDLDTRLNQVVGSNWELQFNINTHQDRVSVVARLTIGYTTKEDCQEELLMTEKFSRDSSGNSVKTATPAELCVMKAAPNAYKRAAVHFGVGAYLYEFKDHVTWEPIDQYRQFTQPIDLSKLPAFAKPTPSVTLVLNELKYLMGTDDKDILKDMLMTYFGIDTLKDLDQDSAMRLAACIARISDYCDAECIDPKLFLDTRIEKGKSKEAVAV